MTPTEQQLFEALADMYLQQHEYVLRNSLGIAALNNHDMVRARQALFDAALTHPALGRRYTEFLAKLEEIGELVKLHGPSCPACKRK